MGSSVQRPARPAVVLAALAMLVVAGTGAVHADEGATPAAGPPTGPAAAVLPATAVVGSTAPAPTADGVRRALRSSLRDSSLGLTTSAAVLDPADGTVLYAEAPDVGRIPASTLKVLTALAALDALGPDARLATRVVQGASPGRIVLVGAGDSTLTSAPQRAWPRPASLTALAESTADALAADGTASVRLAYDDTLFTGPTLGPGWPSSFPALGVVAPVTALMVDGGRAAPGGVARVSDPAAAAAERFADLLRAEGIGVRSVRRAAAPEGAAEVARAESPTVAVLVEHTLTESDNDMAEALAHLAGAAASGTGSFASGAEATVATMAELGITTDGTALVDGSGLSRENRTTASALVQSLALVARQEPAASWPVSPGLPVAGFTGTLTDRFRGLATRAGAGVVRAKTGTLTGVSSLAGSVRDADGRLLTFAFLADDVTSLIGAREAMDRAATRLARCGCS